MDWYIGNAVEKVTSLLSKRQDCSYDDFEREKDLGNDLSHFCVSFRHVPRTSVVIDSHLCGNLSDGGLVIMYRFLFVAAGQ